MIIYIIAIFFVYINYSDTMILQMLKILFSKHWQNLSIAPCTLGLIEFNFIVVELDKITKLQLSFLRTIKFNNVFYCSMQPLESIEKSKVLGIRNCT